MRGHLGPAAAPQGIEEDLAAQLSALRREVETLREGEPPPDPDDAWQRPTHYPQAALGLHIR